MGVEPPGGRLPPIERVVAGIAESADRHDLRALPIGELRDRHEGCVARCGVAPEALRSWREKKRPLVVRA